MKLRVKHIRKYIKDLPDDALFEIDISNGKIGKRSASEDIRNKGEVEFGVYDGKDKKIFYINIPLYPSYTRAI